MIIHNKTGGAGIVVASMCEYGGCKCRRPLKYGTTLLGLMASLNGGLFTAHFRQRMVLRNRARAASYIPTLVIPFITTSLIQDYILYNRLLGNKPQCQLCSDVNVMSAQVCGFSEVNLELI